MEDYLKLGVIQTTLDSTVAWDPIGTNIHMCDAEAKRAWNEIVKAFTLIKTEPKSRKPQIVLLPEFSLPLDRKGDLARIATKLNIVIIAGKDFIQTGSKVRNEAAIIIPNNWNTVKKSYKTRTVLFGKRFFSNEEKMYFEKRNVDESPTPYIHLIDAGVYGNIGVAICADFFDIERFVVYKGKIQHLFIIAYNKDINSFYFLAEAISRLVYCNVVICNTGHYGGSLAFSPYKDSHKRNILKLEGKDMFNTHIITLPVSSLKACQDENDPKILSESEFKSPPPGYQESRDDNVI